MDWKENMTKEDYEKAIQGAEDRVRTQLYSEKIKPLETELEGLKPSQKSEKELELEKKEKELLAKENQFKVRDTLEKHNLPKDLGKYINISDELDIEDVGKELGEIINNFVLDSSYKPEKKVNKGDAISKEDFKKMNYTQRLELYDSNPDLYKKLSN
ncbi:hypothetical protein [Senegalia massiliensis]|uniref:DUF4355 domain-containing protein n=1 Tax=Senegalia massiliensis TaxID=1720316 RepID=A0A845QWY1_9CLOT|nr:hypothetical protein [Senegalia massiliensis]NBI06630.1 hypothetical protein [Senegalia massiliensis]